MPPTSRDDARIERRLIATLTEACETAKTEIPGFAWLTHTVDYRAFPPKPARDLDFRQPRQPGTRPINGGRQPHA